MILIPVTVSTRRFLFLGRARITPKYFVFGLIMCDWYTESDAIYRIWYTDYVWLYMGDYVYVLVLYDNVSFL